MRLDSDFTAIKYLLEAKRGRVCTAKKIIMLSSIFNPTRSVHKFKNSKLHPDELGHDQVWSHVEGYIVFYHNSNLIKPLQNCSHVLLFRKILEAF